MSMKILKASAGSGKTFSLTREYIRMLLTSDEKDAYKHILAVTFTNKATDEMKRRILKELHVLATHPDRSPYINAFVPSVIATSGELKSKAQRLLVAIVNDYSAFAVSTIDKFFQQTLRAFSREIGQFTSYQVELDKNMLVDDAVDRVLTGLSETNRPLLEWIIRGVKSELATTGKFNLDKRLKDLAMNIVNENPAEIGYRRDDLANLKTACDETISSFVQEVTSTARGVLDAFSACGVDPGDTNRGFAKALYDYAQVRSGELIPPPSASFMDKASDPEKWFAKTKSYLRSDCEATMYDPLAAFCDLFKRSYKVYATAFTINGQIYGLGLAGELRKAFVEAQRDRGVISIEDTNSILHEIIDGTDTPFLYEKLGVRYENFLLDEFQDTSDIQWDNFIPLLQNSDAEGHENLVVGDVKQSIYRWRGGQWSLLDHRLQEQFHVPASDITVLDGNYRTCRSVVNFNNGFFPWAAAEMDRLIGNNPASAESLTNIYGDVVQEVRTGDRAEGSVSVRFVENADSQFDEIVASIRDVLSRGAKHRDIAVLVRGNAEGSNVAERLVNEGIPVISDDSLYVKGSVTVRRLVSQLSLIDNPARGEKGSVPGFLASEMHLNIPDEWHSLTDLAEAVLAELREASPELFDAETPFIQAFMDWLDDWTRKNGNILGTMLADWEEATPKIASPEGGDAVRIMTIHKSKGLEFPYVILPFAEKIALYKMGTSWCKPDLHGTSLERFAGKRYRATLSDASLNTLFGEDYTRERSLQAVDNLNVLYVAMTRAKCELKVISVMPTKAVIDAVAKGVEVPAKNLSHLLYAYVGGNADYSNGERYDYTALGQSQTGVNTIELSYVCHADSAKKRMVFHVSSKTLADEAAEDVLEVTAVGGESGYVETVIEPTLF